MGKLFCMMGKSASGKDTIFKKLTSDAKLSVKTVVPYTTRPMRQGEVNGKDYYFVSDGEYEKMQQEGRIIESRTYQTVMGPWHYFTADDGQIELEHGSSIIIGTLEAYMQIREYFDRDQVVPIYVEVEDGLRLERALAREKMQQEPKYAEMCRRFLADCEDFSEEKLEAAKITKRYQNVDMEQCCADIREDVMEYCTNRK